MRVLRIGVAVAVLGACAAGGVLDRPLHLLRQRPEAPEPVAARRLSPEAGDADPRPQRRRHRRARVGEAHRRRLRRHPQGADPRRGGRRGRRLLPARRPRLPRHGARVHRGRASRPAGAGGLDHHPAGGEDAAAVARADAAPQGAGDHPRPPAHAEAVEGGRARALPQPDLLRPRPLRLRGGGALLLRQVGARRDPGRGGAARRASPEPRAALAAQAPRGGEDPPALRAGTDGGARLHRSQDRRPGGGRAHPSGSGAGLGARAGGRGGRPGRLHAGRTAGGEERVRERNDGGHHHRRPPAGAWPAPRSSTASRSSTRAKGSAGRPGTSTARPSTSGAKSSTTRTTARLKDSDIVEAIVDKIEPRSRRRAARQAAGRHGRGRGRGRFPSRAPLRQGNEGARRSLQARRPGARPAGGAGPQRRGAASRWRSSSARRRPWW